MITTNTSNFNIIEKLGEAVGETAKSSANTLGNVFAIVLPIFFAVCAVIFGIQWVLEVIKKNSNPDSSRNSNEVIKMKMLFTLISIVLMVISGAIVGALFAFN